MPFSSSYWPMSAISASATIPPQKKKIYISLVIVTLSAFFRASVGLGELGVFILPDATDEEYSGEIKTHHPVVELLLQRGNSRVGGDSALEYSDVAVGGTFDSLHAGHRLLLAVAALVASETVWLGIASDALLAKKVDQGSHPTRLTLSIWERCFTHCQEWVKTKPSYAPREEVLLIFASLTEPPHPIPLHSPISR